MSSGGIGEKSQPFQFHQFMNLNADEINQKIKGGQSKDEIYDAGVKALNQMGSTFLKTHAILIKDQYMANAEKFVKLFPEKQEFIDVINKFVHDQLGIEKKFEGIIPDAKAVAQLQLKDFPVLTTEQTINALKDKPIGTVMVRRSSDPQTINHLVIAVKKATETPPYYIIGQVKYPPAPNNKFSDITGKVFTIEELVKYYETTFKPPNTLEECEKVIIEAKKEADIESALKKGADKNLMKAAAEGLIRKYMLDPSLDSYTLKFKLLPIITNLKALGGKYNDMDAYNAAELISMSREILKSLISSSSLPAMNDLERLQNDLEYIDYIPLMDFAQEAVERGFKQHLSVAMVKYMDQVKDLPASPPQSKPPPTSLADLPVMDGAEAFAQLKDKPVGAWLFRRSADPKTSDSFVIVQKTAKGVEQAKLNPTGEPGKFIDLNNATYTITELYNIYNTNWPVKNAFHDAIQAFKNLQFVAAKAAFTIPEATHKAYAEKVIIPFLQSIASPGLQKALAGKLSELTPEEIAAIPKEMAKFSDFQIPEKFSIPALAEAVLNYVTTHQEEINKNPAIATRAHQILHDFAQSEIANGNIKSAFTIEGKAATEIPLHNTHPLNQMDKAILEGSAKQYDVKSGAYFSSLDTSIVKGGNLHATQRTIDGKLLNCFDFKVSHYARDELAVHLDAIQNNKADFEASLPKGFCSAVKINQDVPQQFNRYDDATKEFTRFGGYCPKNSRATEIVFEGAGKIIIGNSKVNGTMYNWIQVEVDANLPTGEGAKKLHQLLAVVGLGPVLGQQPPESDERMKIAQLFRAFYPSRATVFDVKKEFYQLPIDELKKKIVADVPQMAPIFKKYLETSPELMTKIEIMPGKEIWGIKDLGKQMKAKGAWGLMTGVGNSGSANTAVERILTQGALSSEQRFESGNFKVGQSSEDDMLSGGGDQVFTRLINNTTAGYNIPRFRFSGGAQILWDIEKTVQRVPYGYNDDKYGIKNRFLTSIHAENSYHDYRSRSDPITLASKISEATNEFAIKNALDPSYVVGVVVQNQKAKDDLIKHLKNKGLIKTHHKAEYVEFAGKKIKVDDFIHVGDHFKKEWWG